MRMLEDEIGCRLLDRLDKKVVLTQADGPLLRRAEKILMKMEAVFKLLGKLRTRTLHLLFSKLFWRRGSESDAKLHYLMYKYHIFVGCSSVTRSNQK